MPKDLKHLDNIPVGLYHVPVGERFYAFPAKSVALIEAPIAGNEVRIHLSTRSITMYVVLLAHDPVEAIAWAERIRTDLNLLLLE